MTMTAIPDMRATAQQKHFGCVMRASGRNATIFLSVSITYKYTEAREEINPPLPHFFLLVSVPPLCLPLHQGVVRAIRTRGKVATGVVWGGMVTTAGGGSGVVRLA